MAKARPVRSDVGDIVGYKIQCPGCNETHVVYTNYPGHPEKNWSFNGNVDSPTFSPSLLLYGHPAQGQCAKVPRCHSFIRDGRMQFLDDCEHVLKGQTVDLPDIED